MADVTFAKTFTHVDWIDNEDVVQASGDKGFNLRFRAIEHDFKGVSTAVKQLNTEIKNVQQLKFVQAESEIEIAAGKESDTFQIEIYSKDDLPQDIDKAYFVVIYPQEGPKYIQHTILYDERSSNRVAASVVFFNPGSEDAKITFRIMNLAVQTG